MNKDRDGSVTPQTPNPQPFDNASGDFFENLAVHFSSLTNEWETPQGFFDELDREFNFLIDVCATSENAKCESYFTIADDGLSCDWWPYTCWMNPPYGREISKWVAKAHHEATQGATVVCLIPSRTDTAYWHEYVIKPGYEVRFVRGRLRFGGSKWNAPFPSAVVIMRIPEALSNEGGLE